MDPRTLIIRPALASEAALLTQIAHDAKRHWGYPEHWILHWQTELTISCDFVSNNQVYVAEHDGEIVGFYALVLHGERAELEHLWVAPAHLGEGIGKELFVHAMQQAAGENVSAVEISSDPNAKVSMNEWGREESVKFLQTWMTNRV